MRFYWIRNRVSQGQFLVHWKRGSDNHADYFTKHHAPALIDASAPATSMRKSQQLLLAMSYSDAVRVC